ncbi:amidohydrolase family protein [Novosphingobium bradum]|uniref:Amidohydrolase family protein n=1 Tax=Novosphingobium bradum TaxID=1737444 RepID=A0ABV7IV51_9SPHN
MHDLVIRGGLVVDGSGGAPVAADVAVRDGLIFAVGEGLGPGREEIDAAGQVVTPGFVDIHTHYDGHATWSSRLAPSSQHGVTTVVTGNCGVGFAPCAPADRQRLIALMEGVEDIPEAVMSAGLPWTWESFGDYLDLLASRQFDMDVATQLPHAPLRLAVMGSRAMAREPATPDDIARMRRLAAEAIAAGALGFSSSRSLNHKASDGSITPTYGAAADELAGIALGLRDAGAGVLQIISDFDEMDAEFAILRRMAGESGRPLSFSLMQVHLAPHRWRELLDRVDQARAEGLDISGQVSGRPVGIMGGFDFSRNPFINCPTYRALMPLPAAERAGIMRRPEVRAAILAEFDAGWPEGQVGPDGRGKLFNLFERFAQVYELADGSGYEPDPAASMAARAEAAGQSAAAFTYDLLLDRGCDTVLFVPAVNFADNSIAAVREMLDHPATILGLGDGGAHCGMICDASLPTYMLTRWVGSGDWPLERAIHALTRRTAMAVGLADRGLLAPGHRADINVIDLAALALPRPQIHFDLPEQGRRIGQDPTGYAATLVAGQVTYRHGQPTGALPGRLVRGAQVPASRH